MTVVALWFTVIRYVWRARRLDRNSAHESFGGQEFLVRPGGNVQGRTAQVQRLPRPAKR